MLCVPLFFGLEIAVSCGLFAVVSYCEAGIVPDRSSVGGDGGVLF